MKFLLISKGTELLRVPVDRLMYVASEGNYSHVTTLDGRTRLVSLQLGQIEDMIDDLYESDSSSLMRLGKCLIINTDYIYHIDVTRQQLILSDCAGSWHELSASKEVLAKLKAHVETFMRNEHAKE